MEDVFFPSCLSLNLFLKRLLHLHMYLCYALILSLNVALSELGHQLNSDIIYEGTTPGNCNYYWEGNKKRSNPSYSLPTTIMRILLTDLRKVPDHLKT